MKAQTILFVTLLAYSLGIASAAHAAAPDSGQQRLGTPAPPLPDPTGINKVRFISLVPPASGGDSALRVNLVSLHHVDPPYTAAPTIPFTIFEGQSVWVGPPAQYLESSSNPSLFFFASHTQCEPHYRDWSTIALLHVTGSHIVPSSVFRVEAVSDACAGVEDSPDCVSGGINVSTSLDVATDRWGDVETPYNSLAGPRQPSFSDMGAIDKKFRSHPLAPIKVRVLNASSTAFGEITAANLSVDIGLTNFANTINAFTGRAYPFKMGKCAGNPNPPATGACSSDAECNGSNGAPPCLLYCPD